MRASMTASRTQGGEEGVSASVGGVLFVLSKWGSQIQQFLQVIAGDDVIRGRGGDTTIFGYGYLVGVDDRGETVWSDEADETIGWGEDGPP